MHNNNQPIGIEFITVLGMPPVEFVNLVADLGCRHIGIAPQPIVADERYPAWSLRDDAALRREFKAALRDTGVSISIAEGFLAWPNKDIRDLAPDLDLMAELGAKLVNVLTLDADRNRAFDQLAIFANLAADRNLATTLEFVFGLPVGDLLSALAAIRHANTPNFRLLLDAMHVFRSGSTAADIAALDPNEIGYVQLCDVPLVSRYDDYSDEARFDRLVPGDGELPLLDFLKAIPGDMFVGVEVPRLTQAQAGVTPADHVSNCLAASRRLMSQAGR